MTTDPIDQEFERFRRTRAPEALAAVFDAAAPRLLLVAMHLCGDAAAAEDLVQTVFLQALRDVDRHTPGRPVLPWLLGILEHRAHDHRHRAHRRREGGAEGLQVADRAPGPDRLAADAEARRQVAEAIASLPREYREVLTLRLVHGLRAIDIAHTQGASPATVRTRLRRGLAMLRTSLPRGLATPALLALFAEEALRASDGLPAIKAALLRAVPQGLPAAAGASLAKWMLGAACAVAGLLLASLAWAPMLSPANATDAAAGSAAASASLPAPFPAHDVAAPEAEPAQRAPAPVVSERDPRATTVRGRIVDAATRAPLADVRVELSSCYDPTRGERVADWRDPEPVQSGVDGTFAFVFVPPAQYSFEVEIGAPGRLRIGRSLTSLRHGVTAELGDFALAPGTPLQFRVEVDGRPAPDVEVYAAGFVAGVAPADLPYRGTTDAAGGCDLGVSASGRWSYELRTEAGGPRTGEFVVPLRLEEFVQHITLQAPPKDRTLAGTLVDARGAPVEDVELMLPVPSGNGYLPARTQHDGTFVVYLPKAMSGEGRWHVELPANRTDLEWIDRGGALAWGRQDLWLVVRRRALAALRLEVVDANGAPIEHYGANCWPDGWALRSGDMPNVHRVPSELHAGGVCTLARLRPGPARASVFGDAPLGERAELPIVLDEGRTTTLRVVLKPPLVLPVEVVAADTGEPVPGVRLALAKVVPEDRLDRVQADTPHPRLELVRRGGSTSNDTNVIEVASSVSDASGHARLDGPQDTPALVLFADGPGCVPTLVRGVRVPGDGLLRVVVARAALVRGIVRPVAFVQRFCELCEEGDDEPWTLPDPARRAERMPVVELRAATGTVLRAHVDEHGAFECSGPPGRYTVAVRATVPTGERSGGVQTFGPLATVDLALGAPRELVLDLAASVGARVRAQVFVDGEPWSRAAGLARLDGSLVGFVGGGESMRCTPWLVPGRYVAFADLSGAGENTRLVLGTEGIDVAPDDDRTWTTSLTRRRLALGLRTAEGAPLAARRLVLRPLDVPAVAFAWAWAAGAHTDAAGQVLFDPAPPGRIEVRAFADGREPAQRDAEPTLVLGTLDAGQTSATLAWPR